MRHDQKSSSQRTGADAYENGECSPKEIRAGYRLTTTRRLATGHVIEELNEGTAAKPRGRIGGGTLPPNIETLLDNTP